MSLINIQHMRLLGRCVSPLTKPSRFSCKIHRNYSNGFSSTDTALTSGMTPQTLSLAEGVLSSNRASLARAITLVESSRDDHQQQASLLLSYVIKSQRKTNSGRSTFRVGISGPPGVGKSTFIEALGTYLCTKKQYKIAVLAVDPSSVRTGGSILGDVTRMEELSRQPNAYIRGSPSRGTLGGVTRHTSDAIALCEASGHDIILVETVGVGQSETAVEGMTDLFMMLAPPAGGDELQGIKKGIMELVDLVVINKADGELLPVAKRAAAEFRTALHFLAPKSEVWTPQVRLCSALSKNQIDDVWKTMELYWSITEKTGYLEGKRKSQRQTWMWKILQEELVSRFSKHPSVTQILPQVKYQVEDGTMTPGMAADKLIRTFVTGSSQQSNN